MDIAEQKPKRESVSYRFVFVRLESCAPTPSGMLDRRSGSKRHGFGKLLHVRIDMYRGKLRRSDVAPGGMRSKQ